MKRTFMIALFGIRAKTIVIFSLLLAAFHLPAFQLAAHAAESGDSKPPAPAVTPSAPSI